MTKHYILSLDPASQYEWERCTLRDPITAEHPVLADLVAKAVGDRAGAYLVAINIEVKVLEEATVPTRSSVTSLSDMPVRVQHAQVAELVA